MKKTWTICFDTSSVQIINQAPELSSYIDLTFKDLLGSNKEDFICSYEVKHDADGYIIFKEKLRVFVYHEAVEIANFLMNAIKHDLTKVLKNKLAIHAALVSNKYGSLLLPGVSGSGKSSLAAGLIKLGFHYHTDELVLIDSEANSKITKLTPFIRPLTVKKSGLQTVLNLFDLSEQHSEIMIGTHASSIPHRLLNPHFIQQPPAIQAIVFPQFAQNTLPSVRSLSAAEATIELMRCNVLARSLPAMGIDKIKHIVQEVPAYYFCYSNFDQLSGLLDDCNLHSA